MKEKILLSLGLSTTLSGLLSLIMNNKENKYSKEMGIISALLITIGSALSLSTLDNILKPEEDEDVEE